MPAKYPPSTLQAPTEMAASVPFETFGTGEPRAQTLTGGAVVLRQHGANEEARTLRILSGFAPQSVSKLDRLSRQDRLVHRLVYRWHSNTRRHCKIGRRLRPSGKRRWERQNHRHPTPALIIPSARRTLHAGNTGERDQAAGFSNCFPLHGRCQQPIAIG